MGCVSRGAVIDKFTGIGGGDSRSRIATYKVTRVMMTWNSVGIDYLNTLKTSYEVKCSDTVQHYDMYLFFFKVKKCHLCKVNCLLQKKRQ